MCVCVCGVVGPSCVRVDVYVCVFVCMEALCTYVCMYIYRYVCRYVCTHVHSRRYVPVDACDMHLVQQLAVEY